MSRISEIDLAGRKYPLNFSTKAMKEMSERYGGLDPENIEKAFSGNAAQVLDGLVWMLHLFISQGVAYKRIVDGEEVKGLTADELEVVLGVDDIASLKGTLFSAMASGSARTVEVEIAPKNGETTQDN